MARNDRSLARQTRVNAIRRGEQVPAGVPCVPPPVLMVEVASVDLSGASPLHRVWLLAGAAQTRTASFLEAVRANDGTTLSVGTKCLLVVTPMGEGVLFAGGGASELESGLPAHGHTSEAGDGGAMGILG